MIYFFKGGHMGVFEQVEALKLQAEQVAQGVAGVKLSIEEFGKAQYDLGFEEGLKQAGQAGGSDKLYSDAELNAELAPLKAKIAELEVKEQQLLVKLAEAESSVPGKVSEALAAFKAELLVKYAEKQVVESAAETGFADLLK